jgi:hypothetical protein
MYACYECCRLVLYSKFDQKQPDVIIRHVGGRMSRDEGALLEPGDVVESPRRFCVDCGVKLGFYRSGDQILTLSGQWLWVCACLVLNDKGSDLSSRRCFHCREQCLHSGPRRNRSHGPVRSRRATTRAGPY